MLDCRAEVGRIGALARANKPTDFAQATDAAKASTVTAAGAVLSLLVE